jgi:hypothetical protein
MEDLFGAPITEADFAPRPKTMIERGLRRYRYRKRSNDVQCCRTCVRAFKRDGRFYKCELVGCTASSASDIKAFNVCDAWEGRK